jgi:hypothetical protein
MQIGLTLEQIGIIIAVISVVVGVILGLQSAKDWSKDRNAGLFLQYQLQAFDEQFIKNLLEITNIWEWKDIKEFWEKYGSPEKFAPELLIATVRSFWLKVSPIAEQIGIDVQRPNTFQNIEYLFNEIQKLDASKAM